MLPSIRAHDVGVEYPGVQWSQAPSLWLCVTVSRGQERPEQGTALSRPGVQWFPALLSGRYSVLMIHDVWKVWLCNEQGSEE